MEPEAPTTAPTAAGCSHYRRNCKLRAACCGELFSCRFCHDAAKSEQEEDNQKKHLMNRHLVKTVVCCKCDVEQPPGPSCVGCGVRFGAYFCSVCNLYDDDLSKQQFHCDECGICRVGGRENFFHCHTCGACYSIELRNNHVCVPNSMQRDCPICYEYLFDSLEAPQVLRCGHTIHRKCLENYSAHGGYTCPLCNASVCDMRAAWLYLDEEIRNAPLPEDLLHQQVEMLCNDCHQRSQTVFHPMGLKCAPCGSYNTRRC